MHKLWEHIVRWRTWAFNLVLAALFIVPDVLNQPEILAVVPEGYHKYILAAAFVINIWLRPRPAVMAKDLK